MIQVKVLYVNIKHHLFILSSTEHFYSDMTSLAILVLSYFCNAAAWASIVILNITGKEAASLPVTYLHDS